MDAITAQVAGAVDAPLLDLPARGAPNEGNEARPDLASIKNIVGAQLDALKPFLKPGMDRPAVVADKPDTPADPPVADSDSPVPEDLGEPAPVSATTVPPVIPDPPEPVEVSKDPKARHAWAQSRAQLKAAQEQAATAIAAEAARAKELADTAAALTELRKSKEALETKLEKIALVESPAFVEKFDGRMRAMQADLQGTISQFVEDPSLAAPLAEKLLKLPVKEFVAETSKLTGSMASVITGAAAAARAGFSQLSKEREEAVVNWKATKQALAEQEAQQGRIRVVEEIDKSADSAFVTAAKGGNFLFQNSASNADWNAKVEARKAAAKQMLLMARSPQELVALVVEGATAAETRKMYADMVAVNKDLRARLAALGQPAPSRVRPSAPPPPPPPPPAGDKPAKADPKETIKTLFTKAGFRQ